MTLKYISLTLIIVFMVFLLVVSFWWIIFRYKVDQLSNKISERQKTIDVILAVKKEFLIKLTKGLNLTQFKKLPKVIINNPKFFWSALEREQFILGLNKWEKEIIDEIKKLKTNNKDVKKALSNIKEIEERITINIFKYNNEVLSYNFLLNSKRGNFFLKADKYQEKQIINIINKIAEK